MKKIILNIRKEFKKNVDPKYKRNLKHFFKEDIKLWGVNSTERKKISKKYFAQVKNLDKQEFFAFCEELLKKGYDEEVCLGLNWVCKYKKYYQKSDFKIFESWLKYYVSNWASCDSLSIDILGYFLFKYPILISKVKRWTQSKNKWLRRASAVTLIYPLRNKMFLKEAFEIADILLADKEDLIQKGYG